MTSLARYFQSGSRQAVMTPLSVAQQGREQIGAGIAQLGANIDAIQERDELFWVQQQMSEIDRYSRDLWDSSVNSAGNGAPDFETNFLSGLDTRYEESRNLAPSQRALRMLETEILGHRTQLGAAAQGFAIEERYQFRADTIRNEADNLGQELFRFPSVDPYSPTAGLTPPSLPAGIVLADAGTYYSSGMAHPHTGEELAQNLDQWESRYYSPRDFADGAGQAGRSGDVMVSRRVLSSLDWVTDQFGYGKLQINSGYRSPTSNLAVADSGAEGPHTHGEALDIQVRDLPQAERNRLYSLFRSAGANAFGFGEGVLHVEWREGSGNGRDGDFEWTYGNAQAYQRVPVAGPGQAGGPDEGVTGGWQSINQYPYLPVVALTARSEAGTTDLASASLSIAIEGDGSASYGALGLNSNGMLPTFIREHGEDFGLTARPGSAEFADQWQTAVRNDPEGMIRAQFEFHQAHIVRPAQNGVVAAGAPAVANDPRVVAYASDLVVQYGPAMARRHMEAGAGARDAVTFINAVTESTRRSLDQDFQTELSADPSVRAGLVNRIDRRAQDAMSIGQGGAIATGNVPAWNGPIPNIEDVPGYADRMRRINAMVDSMGGTPDQRRDLSRALNAQVTTAWLGRVAEINPPAAMAALMSGRYDEALSLADTGALYNTTQSAYATFEARIRENQRELMQNLRTEAQTFLADEIASVVNTGQSLGRLTDAHMAALTDSDRADLSFARFQYQATREIANAPTSELPGILEALTPAGDGFAEEQRRYDFAQSQINDRLQQQQADPAGLAVGTSQALSQTWRDALSSGDPQAVSAAIRAIRARQRDMGVPDHLIQSIPNGAMSAQEDLISGAENADQAFAAFMEMRALFGDEFGSVVADMERAGLSAGWSGVAQIVEGGNVLVGKALARVVHAGEYGADSELGVNLALAGRPEVARMIFDGRLRRSEVPNLMPSGDSERGESANQIVGRYMGDALDQAPRTFQAVREAALSIYATTAVLGGDLNGTQLEQAIDLATGGILSYNPAGQTGRFVAPVPGMTQGQFNDYLARIGEEDLEGAFIGYASQPDRVTPDMLRSTLQFVSSGNGRYFLRYPGAGLARTEDGEPFELDFLGLLPNLIGRQAAEQVVRETLLPGVATQLMGAPSPGPTPFDAPGLPAAEGLQ